MFHDFVAKCLTKEPRLRPTAAEMLKVVFVVNVCTFFTSMYKLGLCRIFYLILFCVMIMDINGFFVVLFICPPTIIYCPQNRILSLRMNSKHICTKCFGDTLANIQFELKYWTGKSMTLFSSTHCLATFVFTLTQQ